MIVENIMINTVYCGYEGGDITTLEDEFIHVSNIYVVCNCLQ
jgi:hypothetical protein